MGYDGLLKYSARGNGSYYALTQSLLRFVELWPQKLNRDLLDTVFIITTEDKPLRAIVSTGSTMFTTNGSAMKHDIYY